MGKQELDNLVKIERLKAESPTRSEYAGMVASARRRLVDAHNEDLDPDSQFDLAYGAAHRLALAALRREGYRSDWSRPRRIEGARHTELASRMSKDWMLRRPAPSMTKKREVPYPSTSYCLLRWSPIWTSIMTLSG